jgi:type I restriction-modification system DNA methylase subunit
MSEELLQRNLLKKPEKIGKWDFYNIGNTTLKALKENNIIRNVDYGAVERKKVDAIIVFRKNVIAVIEYKKPAEFNTKEKQKKAIQQEIEVAKKLGCRLIIATDTQETIWVNALTGKEIKDEKNRVVKVNFDPNDEKTADLIEKINYSINELNNVIKPKLLVNPTDLAKQIWQDIWSVSGATPENCLYTFVELFIFKYLSDLGVLEEGINFNHLLDRYTYTIEKPDEKVLEYYAHTIRPEIKALFPSNPADNTTIINGTIFVSKDQKAVTGYSTVFKKILFKFKDYGKLENIDYDFKSKLFESFLKESISKKNWGQFFTPLKVVRAIIEMAKDDIKDGITICDPACGVGKFLLEPLVTRLSYIYDINHKAEKEEDKIKSKIVIRGFDKGFDKDEQKTIILAKANMLIYFSDLIKENTGLTKEFAKLFNDSFTLKTNSILGTLSDAVTEQYDLILTNPPYVTSGSSNLKEEIKKDGELVKHYKVNALGVEGLFMEWIIKALKPGGKAFVVVPDGMLNRQNDKNLRKYILDECFIDGLVSLPLNTFFTTNKKTYILCITKKTDKKQIQTEPVFTYIVSEIGESRDVYRFDIDQNDLQEAVTLFSFFKGSKQAFSKINTDKRCKIISIDYFKDSIENNWVIDRIWTDKEKIELGIIEEIKSVSLFEFSSIIEEITTSLKVFQEESKELAEKKNSKIEKRNYTVKELFTIKRGDGKYIKRYINDHRGNYPVYSGNTFGSFAYIDTFDYKEPCLSWVIDGLAGYIMIHNEKFSATNHRGVLFPKTDELNLKYCKYILEPLFRQTKKGRIGIDGGNEYTALPPFMIEHIEFPVPIDENGRFDAAAQAELVEKYEFISDVKAKIAEYKQEINDLVVESKENYFIHRDVSIFDTQVFSLERGKRITRKTINLHQGIIPVYSSSKDANNILGLISEEYLQANHLILYTVPSILFNLDGSVGHCFMKTDEKYSFTDVVASIRPLTDKIDLNFLLFALQNELKKTGADYRSKLYFHRMKEYDILIKIPIDSNGEFDLAAQEEIAEKYKKIEQIKKNISEELNNIANITIEIE